MSDTSNPDANTSSQQQQLWQTTIRQSITPYLPPPVNKAIKTVDPQLEPFMGPEGSVTTTVTILLAFLLWQIFKLFLSSTSSSGKAIQDDPEEEDNILQSTTTSKEFDGTILICGPSMAGKTSLLGQLLRKGNDDTTPLITVKSIKSNTGYLINENNDKTWRIVDTPGHWGPDKLLPMLPEIQRIVVVVDSTQPVAQAADYLYALYTSDNNNNNPSKLLIACHKSQHPKAKNLRRIKLQLRSELERIAKLKGNSQNLEERLNDTPMCASHVGEGGNVLEDVQRFCWTGESSNRSEAKR